MNPTDYVDSVCKNCCLVNEVLRGSWYSGYPCCRHCRTPLSNPHVLLPFPHRKFADEREI